MKNRQVAIVGMGLHPWGVWPDKSMAELGTYAIQNALNDAGLNWRQVDAMVAGAYLWMSQQAGVPGALMGTSITSLLRWAVGRGKVTWESWGSSR